MGMSSAYGVADDTESTLTLHRALDFGVSFVDTADIYGVGHNEQLVGRALGRRRHEVVLATKCGFRYQGGRQWVDGTPTYVRSACDASLRRLGVDHIDLYYQHRVDPTVPIEDTVGAMAELVAAGKVRYVGLSEASARSVERACAEYPIAALQSEWSLWTRDIETDVLAVARAHQVGIVAFSPLGRGFLSGGLTSPRQITEGDSRRDKPRFQAGNFAKNLGLLADVRSMAAEKSCSIGQLALAWLLAKGDDVVPVFGTRTIAHLEENLDAVAVALTGEDIGRLNALGAAVGARYHHDSGYGNSPEKL